ncbi:N-terminal acetyltransferase A complex catalytic subunit ard1 [Xylogone sp. PMI_703]|nr:N-terminal acetyltransferase A complex catalytic subunit ard1 [Xylogone sp. PMI_703]
MNFQPLSAAAIPAIQNAGIAVAGPPISYIASDARGSLTGFVLSQMEISEDGTPYGSIVGLVVAKPYRKLGVAEELMKHTQRAMVEAFGAKYIQLHVPTSNPASLDMYRDTLGFVITRTESKYYADGEDAFLMKLDTGCLLLDQTAVDNNDDEGELVGELGKAGTSNKRRRAAKNP